MSLPVQSYYDGTPCQLWTGYLTDQGYGKLGGRLVHRLAWELVNGPVPDGLTLDHLCHTLVCAGGPTCPHRRCINVRHMTPATRGDNARRGQSGTHQKIKTNCPQGHEYTPENTRVYRGGRYCRTCGREATRRWGQRRRAA